MSNLDIYTRENHSTPPNLSVSKVKGNLTDLEVWFTWHDQESTFEILHPASIPFEFVADKETE